MVPNFLWNLNEQNWINAKPTANHIDSGYEGDNETVDDEAFIQFEKPMDVELSVEDVVQHLVAKGVLSSASEDKKNQSNVGCAANPITIGSDSDDSVKIEAILPPKRASNLLDISKFGPKVATTRKMNKSG